MCQSFIPDRTVYFDYNGVGWYLSTSLVLWFFAPFVHNYLVGLSLQRCRNRAILIYCIQLMITCVLVKSEYANAILYVNPFFRIGDLFIGLALGRMYTEKKIRNSINTRIMTFLEIGIFLLFLLVCYLSYDIPIAFAYNVFFSPICAMLIYILACSRGRVSLLLSNPVLEYIGKNSIYIFLVHYLMIQWSLFIWDKEVYSSVWLLIFSVCLTAITSYIIYFFNKTIRGMRSV